MKEEPGAAGMDGFCDHIDGGRMEILIVKPLPECESGAVGAVAITDARGNLVKPLLRSTGIDQTGIADAGGGVVVVGIGSGTGDWSTRGADVFVVRRVGDDRGGLFDRVKRNPTFDDQEFGFLGSGDGKEGKDGEEDGSRCSHNQGDQQHPPL